MKSMESSEIILLNWKRIKCAAIKSGDLMVSGYRHNDCFANLKALRPEADSKEFLQGFIDMENRFYNQIGRAHV